MCKIEKDKIMSRINYCLKITVHREFIQDLK